MAFRFFTHPVISTFLRSLSGSQAAQTLGVPTLAQMEAADQDVLDTAMEAVAAVELAELTEGPVRSSGSTSSIADNALSISMTNGLQPALDALNEVEIYAADSEDYEEKTPVSGATYRLRASAENDAILLMPASGYAGQSIAFTVINEHDYYFVGVYDATSETSLSLLWQGIHRIDATSDGTNWTVKTTDVSSVINSAPEDTAPLAADRIPLTETAAGGALRWLSFTNLWVWIKAQIDLGQTWAGLHSFSSTTRPTSAGTGVPGATSLITEADMRERYVADMTNVYVRQQMGWDAGPWVTVGASPSYLLDGNGVVGARLIGPTTQAAASAQGGGIKYPDGGVTGGTMTALTRAFQMRFLFRNTGGQAGANAFFLSLRNNADFWSNSSVGLYHVAQPANAWQAGTLYVAGDRVNVSGIVQVVSTGGTSGGAEPSWNTARNGTTTDNTVTWRNLGPHTSNKWALGFVDASGIISLTDTGVSWVAGTSATTLLSLRSDGASIFASVNGSAEVSVSRGALTAATPYIMGRGDTNLTHRIHGLLFTLNTTPQ